MILLLKKKEEQIHLKTIKYTICKNATQILRGQKISLYIIHTLLFYIIQLIHSSSN